MSWTHLGQQESAPAAPEGPQLQHLFFASAAAAPEHIAIVELDDRGQTAGALTYGALARKARRLARHLIAGGVEPGDRVLMVMPRGPQAICAEIAILTAGATFVPLDFATPAERIAFAAKDSRSRHAVCSSARSAELAALGLTVVRPETAWAEADVPDDAFAPPPSDDGEAIAYVIYTSGSTGNPKGVAVRHRNIRHFVAAEGSVLALAASDRVFQAFSYAFDMSIEEIWPTLAAGATLVVATEAIAKSGPDVVEAVIAAEVTVWHAVPSLIGMISRDPPNLRLLNLGGEACPAELVRRWCRADRRVLNTYGPTETTVSATYAELRPGEPVTIGAPLPGYEAIVLDGGLQPVPDNGEGELCIGGEGVSAGYLNLPEPTAEKFLVTDVGSADGRSRLLYRTGDLVRRDTAGRLEFLGRIDAQVKIRGYRVELGEIENAILEAGDVRAVAVALHRLETGGERLVAHIVADPDAQLNLAAIRRRLAARLPDYMIPGFFELTQSLPTLASGKIDRKRLAAPTAAPLGGDDSQVAPRNAAERDIASVCAEILGYRDVSVEADFFTDLGGHSLRAGQLVSKLRQDVRFAHVSMGDVYRCRTIARLAANLATAHQTAESPSFAAIEPARYLWCLLAQTGALVVLFGLGAAAWAAPFLAYYAVSDWGAGQIVALAASLGGALLAALCGAALPILVRALFGRLRPGVYPLWGLVYFRWWLLRRSLSFAPLRILSGTPVMAMYLRWLGAEIGAGALIATTTIDVPELLTIGDGATLCRGSTLSVSSVEGGELHLGPIAIAGGAVVGLRSAIGRGATIGPNARIEDLTLIGNNCAVGAGEVWSGSPARPRLHSVERLEKPEAKPASLAMTAAFTLAGALLYLLPTCAVGPGLAIVVAFGKPSSSLGYLEWAPLMATCFPFSMAGLVAATKWLSLGRAKPRSAPYWSAFHLRLWIAETACDLALSVLHPLYGTLYLRPFYRLLGMRYGRGAEMTTATDIVHDLVEIGDRSFVADGASIGAPRFARGVVTIERTSIGRHSFVGNYAVIPQQSALADDTLVGVMSRPPASSHDQARAGTSWFGSP
ncbi:MAG: amino acid adenylation domain-containing protein, partial [Hyphomicrobiales bacterium]|nr:amino acid adenylation domain-containing protein [Hyphomicrobiales bacterium]